MKNERFCRRTLLRSLGIGAGFLPLLNAERAPGAQGENGYPTRLITITWTNGIVPSGFYPPAGPIDAPLPALLSPLEAHRSKILALRSANGQRSPIDLQVMLDADQTYNGHQSYPALLTGTWRDGMHANGASIDVLIAEHLTSLGVVSPLLNLGARPYASSTSYRASGERNSSQTDPYRLLGTLFAGVPTTPGTTPPPGDPTMPTAADALRARRGSVLDFVGGELERFGSRFGTEDRAKVQLHLEAIRELERKLGAQPGGTGGTGSTGGGVPVGASCAAPSLPDKPNFQDVQNYPAHVAATLAVAGAAVKCDLARCITIDLIDDGGGNSLTFPWLDIHSPDYHAIAHEGPNSYGEKSAIDSWFFSEIAKLVSDLANTPEGDGTLLDNCCILIANDMNEGSNHYVGDIPYLIVGGCGGFFKQGETVSLPRNVPNNYLLTTVCHAMGLPIDSVGEYSGNLDAELGA
jgi:hypothetical protein